MPGSAPEDGKRLARFVAKVDAFVDREWKQTALAAWLENPRSEWWNRARWPRRIALVLAILTLAVVSYLAAPLSGILAGVAFGLVCLVWGGGGHRFGIPFATLVSAYWGTTHAVLYTSFYCNCCPHHPAVHSRRAH